jgi:four helix bundle protein
VIRSYRDLIVWQKSMDLTVDVYHLTRAFPSDERFGLTAQIRRRAGSIPANVAEGHSRHSRGDYRRSTALACGSLAELETHLEIGLRMEYVDRSATAAVLDLTDQVGKVLSTLHRKLRS